MIKFKKYVVVVVTSLLVLGINIIPCSATELQTVPAAQETTKQEEETIGTKQETKEVAYLKIKAEVSEEFSDIIDISYQGENSNEFSVSLSQANEYETIIPIIQDAYTLKSLNATSGIDMEIAKSFSLVNADINKIYLLPISVYQSTVQTESEINYIRVKVSAESNITELGYTGSIIVNYTGTNGNVFSVLLDSESNYTKEIEIKKDIYTVDSVIAEEGFQADAMYSFDLTKASKEITYLLEINIQEKTSEETTPAEKEEVTISEGFSVNVPQDNLQEETILTSNQSNMLTKNGVIHLQDGPDGYTGGIIVSYKGINGNEFAVNLSAANSYTAVIAGGIPYDIYTLEYIMPTETIDYEFSGENLITVNEDSASSIVLPIYAKKTKTDSGKSENSIEISTTQILIIIIGVLVLIIIIVVVIFIIKKKQREDFFPEADMHELKEMRNYSEEFTSNDYEDEEIE